jgi:hypothetical protein
MKEGEFLCSEMTFVNDMRQEPCHRVCDAFMDATIAFSTVLIELLSARCENGDCEFRFKRDIT